MKVYEKITEYIERNNVSAEQLAKITGITLKDIKTILDGGKVLHADELREICIALNVKPEIFL